MAKLTVNIGSSANDRTGDNLRTAFNKINTNFTEVYDDISDLTTRLGVVETGGTVSLTTDTKGSVFADDSTLLVDAVNAIIPAAVVSGTLTNDLTGTVTGSLLGNSTGYHTGDVLGSVFADDSTLLVDGVNGTIPASNLSGALPAIDGSALTGVSGSYVKAMAHVDVSNPITMTGNFGIASITTSVTGVYDIVFTTPFADNHYMVIPSIERDGSNVFHINFQSRTTTGFKIYTYDKFSSLVGTRNFQFVIFKV